MQCVGTKTDKNRAMCVSVSRSMSLTLERGLTTPLVRVHYLKSPDGPAPWVLSDMVDEPLHVRAATR
jgi:hypothetical protein